MKKAALTLVVIVLTCCALLRACVYAMENDPYYQGSILYPERMEEYQKSGK